MNQDDQNFHSMVRAVLRTRADHPNATASPVLLVRVFDRVASLEAVLNSARRAGGVPLKPITEAKDSLKRLMADAVVVVLGLLEAHASFSGDAKLATQAHVEVSHILSPGDLDAANHALNLLELLTAPRVVALKAEAGLTDEQLNVALSLQSEFAAAVGSSRSATANSVSHGALADWAIGELRSVLNTQLDPLVRQFNLQPKDSGSLTKKAFHDAYSAARVIVDIAGGRSGDEDESPAPQPPAA